MVECLRDRNGEGEGETSLAEDEGLYENDGVGLEILLLLLLLLLLWRTESLLLNKESSVICVSSSDVFSSSEAFSFCVWEISFINLCRVWIEARCDDAKEGIFFDSEMKEEEKEREERKAEDELWLPRESGIIEGEGAIDEVNDDDDDDELFSFCIREEMRENGGKW